MEQLTGREAERYDSGDVGSLDQIRQWLNEGRPLCVNTTTATKKVNKAGYVAYHSYYVVGVEGDTILLPNPWGWEEGRHQNVDGGLREVCAQH